MPFLFRNKKLQRKDSLYKNIFVFMVLIKYIHTKHRHLQIVLGWGAVMAD